LTTSKSQSQFARRFAALYEDVRLPAVYRAFILGDAYLPYRRSFISGLATYGPGYVELELASTRLLNRTRLFNECELVPDEVSQYHPIAMLHQSPQFLAIDTAVETAPVLLWHHETGAFQPQFETFSEFNGLLRTPAQMRAARRQSSSTLAQIRAVCKPALIRARRLRRARELDAALREIDVAVAQRSPIGYHGGNDFMTIGILCDCFNMRGRLLLAQGRLREAQAAFLDAVACGGTPWWEALVNAIVTSLLLGDASRAAEQIGHLDPGDFPEPPQLMVRRNFEPQQVDLLEAMVMSADLTETERAALWIIGLMARPQSFD
jgi:hypothetical protein